MDWTSMITLGYTPTDCALLHNGKMYKSAIPIKDRDWLPPKFHKELKPGPKRPYTHADVKRKCTDDIPRSQRENGGILAIFLFVISGVY
ncbi:MAG: hypothetical protein ABIN67_18050 [Ferruginibacter sp.]